MLAILHTQFYQACGDGVHNIFKAGPCDLLPDAEILLAHGDAGWLIGGVR